VRFSIPVIGPLLAMSAAHPVMAAATAVLVVGGVGTAGGAALTQPHGPAPIARGFQMKTSGRGGGPPIGYDLSQTPPVVAGRGRRRSTNEGTDLMSTSDELAVWSGQGTPTAAECRTAVKEHPNRIVTAYPHVMICFVDQNQDPGYIPGHRLLVGLSDGRHRASGLTHRRSDRPDGPPRRSRTACRDAEREG